MNVSQFRTQRAQGGFTLIELIVVIVILGILAATALPKFADMGGEARKASLKAARGSLEAVSAMVHGKALITPTALTVTMEDVTVTITNGYPAAAVTTAYAAGLSTTDWDSKLDGTDLMVSPKGIDTTKVATCNIKYTGATTSTLPKYTIVDSGC